MGMKKTEYKSNKNAGIHRWAKSVMPKSAENITDISPVEIEKLIEITEAEAEMKRLASFPRLNPNPIAEVDLMGQIHYLNPAAERLLPDLRKRGREHPWLSDWESLVLNLSDGEEKVTVREVKADVLWWQQSLHLVEEIGQIRIYGMDITKRKQFDEDLRESQCRLEMVLDSIADGFYALDREWHFTHVNDTALRHIGKTRKEILGRTLFDIFPAARGSIIENEYRGVMESGKPRHFENPSLVTGRTLEIHVYPGKDILTILFRDVTEQNRMAAALSNSEATLRGILDASKESIWLFSPDGFVIMCNETALLRFGKSADNVIGKHFNEILSAELAESRLARLKEVIQSAQPIEFEDERGGVIFLNNFYPVINTDGHVYSIACFSRDITDRKQAEMEMKRLNRTLRALSKSTQAMLRATDERIYMEEVCRIILEDCGHAMVWIGFAEGDAKKSVRPMVCTGFDESYLETVNVTWADTDRGRGPTGTAIRTGKPSMCRNMLTDPAFTPWREEALKRGYASSLALPMISDGKAIGALTIYSREPDPFTKDEIHLLMELAGDLTYGIMAIRLRSAHAEAEAALHESEERYHSLFESMTEGFALHEIIYDERGVPCDYRFLDINPKFEELTGLKREDVIGRLVTEILPDEAPKWVELYGDVALTGKSIHFDNYSPVLGRQYEVFAYRPAPGRFATIFMDITERKRMEKALSERTVQLENANKELESFSYSVSHDLRAPLRTIDGFSRMFLKKYGDNLGEDAARMINIVRNNTEKMGGLINDLLSFSRMISNSMSISEIDMDKLVREVWDEIQALHQERELEIKLTKLLPGFGDRALIRQVLFNLLSNAAKFTKNRKPSIIEMSCYSENGNVVYCLKDNGVGFDMAYYDKLFGVFQRLHSNEEYEGTGVGLAIVQRVVQRHGGRVWAEGNVGKGAVFYFTLPQK